MLVKSEVMTKNEIDRFDMQGSNVFKKKPKRKPISQSAMFVIEAPSQTKLKYKKFLQASKKHCECKHNKKNFKEDHLFDVNIDYQSREDYLNEIN